MPFSDPRFAPFKKEPRKLASVSTVGARGYFRKYAAALAEAASEQMPSPEDLRKKYVRRFQQIDRAIDTEGVAVNPLNPRMKRVAILKNRFPQEAVKELGFVPVNVAVPEAGQTRFKSYRHPITNHHIHDHGSHWVVHKDAHSSMPMLAKRRKIMKSGRLDKIRHPLGKPVTSATVKTPGTLKRWWIGLKHSIAEGVPGLLNYLKARFTGGDPMLRVVRRKQSPNLRMKMLSWDPITKGTKATAAKATGAAAKATGVATKLLKAAA